MENLKPLAEHLQVPTIPEGSAHSFMMFPLVLKNRNIHKDKLVHYLEDNNIETRDMLPLVNQPIYKTLFGDIEDQFPVAKNINANGFYIGCHQKITTDEFTFIIDKMTTFFKDHA